MATARASVPPRLHEVEPPPVRLFGPGDAMWDDFGDVIYIGFTAGAFMLQVMHPTINAGVDQHSVFRTDPGGRAVRSFDSVALWVYGGQAAIEEGKRLRVLHRPIHGTNEDGEHYSALNPEAYAWVHGTAFVTTVCIHPYTHGRHLRGIELERAFDEHLRLGEILQIRASDMPQTIPEYWDYYDTMVHDRLERTKVADELVQTTLRPPVKIVPGPLDLPGFLVSRGAGQLLRLLTFAGMTRSAREVLGVPWNRADEAALAALMTVVRPVHKRLPEQVRYVPLALHARRHARELEKIRARSTKEVA